MEAINRALNNAVDVHAGPSDEEKIKSTLDSLNRLVDELELPKNRELVRFLVAWRGLEEDLARLEVRMRERVAEKPINKMNKFLKKLTKKN